MVDPERLGEPPQPFHRDAVPDVGVGQALGIHQLPLGSDLAPGDHRATLVRIVLQEFKIRRRDRGGGLNEDRDLLGETPEPQPDYQYRDNRRSYQVSHPIRHTPPPPASNSSA